MSRATHTAELERRLMDSGITGSEIREIRTAHSVSVPEPEANELSAVLNVDGAE